jgi:hypothetical protein
LRDNGFAKSAWNAYFACMPRKPIELPPEVAKAFVKDLRAFRAESNAIKRDEIAGRQVDALRQYQRPHEKPVRIPDIDVRGDEGSRIRLREPSNDRYGARDYLNDNTRAPCIENNCVELSNDGKLCGERSEDDEHCARYTQPCDR